MPVGDVFVDTNILFYSRQLSRESKRDRAAAWLRKLVAARRARLNLQVLNELANVLLKKRGDLSAQDVFAAIDELAALGTRGVDMRAAVHARQIRLKTGYSWWDCLLLASAIELGCRWFLSEDLQDGHEIEGLTIVDPFAHSPEQILN